MNTTQNTVSDAVLELLIKDFKDKHLVNDERFSCLLELRRLRLVAKNAILVLDALKESNHCINASDGLEQSIGAWEQGRDVDEDDLSK